MSDVWTKTFPKAMSFQPHVASLGDQQGAGWQPRTGQDPCWTQADPNLNSPRRLWNDAMNSEVSPRKGEEKEGPGRAATVWMRRGHCRMGQREAQPGAAKALPSSGRNTGPPELMVLAFTAAEIKSPLTSFLHQE